MNASFIGEYIVLFFPHIGDNVQHLIIQEQSRNTLKHWFQTLIKSGKNFFRSRCKSGVGDIALLQNILHFRNIWRYKNFNFWSSSLCIKRKNTCSCEDRHILYDLLIVNTSKSSFTSIKETFKKIKAKNSEYNFGKTLAFTISFCNINNLNSEEYTMRRNAEASRFLHILDKNLSLNKHYNTKLFVLKNVLYEKRYDIDEEKFFYGVVFPVVKTALLITVKKEILRSPKIAEKIHESSFNGWFSRLVYSFLVRRIIPRKILSYILIIVFILAISSGISVLIGHLWHLLLNLCNISPQDLLPEEIQFAIVTTTIFLLALYITLFINRFREDEARIINSIFLSETKDILAEDYSCDHIVNSIFIESEYFVRYTFKQSLNKYYERLNEKILYGVKFNKILVQILINALIDRFVTGEEDSLVYILRRI